MTLKSWLCGHSEEEQSLEAQHPNIEEVLDAVLGPLDPNLSDQTLLGPRQRKKQ